MSARSLFCWARRPAVCRPGDLACVWPGMPQIAPARGKGRAAIPARWSLIPGAPAARTGGTAPCAAIACGPVPTAVVRCAGLSLGVRAADRRMLPDRSGRAFPVLPAEQKVCNGLYRQQTERPVPDRNIPAGTLSVGNGPFCQQAPAVLGAVFSTVSKVKYSRIPAAAGGRG